MPLPDHWTVNAGVYEPREDSFLLQSVFAQDVQDGERVLDVGTGSGILAWTAARSGAQVTAVDVNPAAVANARENLERSGVSVAVRESDLFEDVSGSFDRIVCNPPYVPGEPELGTAEERAWAGGERGRQVIDRFIETVPQHLAEMGRVLLLQSSRNGVDETVSRFQEQGFVAQVVAREKAPWEELIVIRAARQPVPG